MTTELSYRNEGANVYAQDGTLVCIAVDPLDAEVIAGLLRWKVDIHPEPAPEPDPWPTEPLIVASVDDGGPQLLSVLTAHSAATMTSAIVRRSESTLTNVVPVTVVPVAETEALRASVKALGYSGHTLGTPGSLVYATTRLLSATDALGVSND